VTDNFYCCKILLEQIIFPFCLKVMHTCS